MRVTAKFAFGFTLLGVLLCPQGRCGNFPPSLKAPPVLVYPVPPHRGTPATVLPKPAPALQWRQSLALSYVDEALPLVEPLPLAPEAPVPGSSALPASLRVRLSTTPPPPAPSLEARQALALSCLDKALRIAAPLPVRKFIEPEQFDAGLGGSTGEGEKAMALRDIGEAQALAGDVPAALRTAELIKDGTQDEEVRRVIALQHARAGRWEVALGMARQVKDERSRESWLCDIASLQAKTGDVPAALQTYGEAGSAEARSNAQGFAAAFQAWAKDLPAALRTAEGIQDEQKRDDALLGIAWRTAEIGDPAAALRAIEAVPASSSRDYCVGSIVQAEIKAGDLAGAMQTVEGMKDPYYKAFAWGRVAAAQARQGDTALALETLKRMNEAGLGDWSQMAGADVVAAAALAQAKAGDFAAALRSAESLESSFERQEVLSGIAVTQLTRHDTAGAEDTLARFANGVDKARGYQRTADKLLAWPEE